MASRALKHCFHALVVLVLLAGPVIASAQQGAAAGWAYALPHELMSPFCPGRTLAQCTSPQAEQLRQWILLQESAGASEDEVRANLLDRYSDSILSAPRAEGWGLSAYLLPAVFFVGAGALVFFFLQRLVRNAPRPQASASDGVLAPAPRGNALQEAESVDTEAPLVRQVGAVSISKMALLRRVTPKPVWRWHCTARR